MTAIIIGVVCAIIGVFIILRGLVFFGNGIAHSAFAGGALAILLNLPSPLQLLVITGFTTATAISIGYVNQKAKITNETAIGIFFAFTMALGVIFVSLYKTYNIAISSLLFGSLASISNTELITNLVLALIIISVVLIIRRGLYFLTFDEELAKANGMAVNFLSYTFLILTALTIVMCITTVGIILVMAYIVTPAAAAYQFTYKLKRMIIYSVIFAVIASFLGFMIAYLLDISGSATIAIVLTLMFLISMLISPKRRSRKIGADVTLCIKCEKLVEESECKYCIISENTRINDNLKEPLLPNQIFKDDENRIIKQEKLQENNVSNKESNPIIDLRDISVVLDKNLIIDDINLQIRKGEYIGLIGKNGSGKSTLMKTILGLIKPTKGTVRIFGLPIEKKLSRRISIKKIISTYTRKNTRNNISLNIYDRIGYVSQMHLIQREFPATVRDVVAMGLYKKGSSLIVKMLRLLVLIFHFPLVFYDTEGFVKKFRGRIQSVKDVKKHRKDNNEKVLNALHKVGMGTFQNRPIGHLSGGEQQKVLVAQSLARNPEILLLDEPTAALDFVMVKNFLDLLNTLNKKYGLTLIVIQHNLEMLRPFCSRLIMLKGIIVYDGLPNIPRADQVLETVFS